MYYVTRQEWNNCSFTFVYMLPDFVYESSRFDNHGFSKNSNLQNKGEIIDYLNNSLSIYAVEFPINRSNMDPETF